MKKLYNLFLITGILLSISSCKKNEPLEDMGTSNGNYRAELRVTVSNRRPALGEVVNVTASTWQKDDKIGKVEFLHSLYENFGIRMELDKTSLTTWSATDPVAVISDTIKKEEVWNSISSINREIDNYYVTASKNYVISSNYTLFNPVPGKYSMSGAELLLQIPDEPFNILKNQLSFVIAVSDFEKLFPAAPANSYTVTGTTRTGITDAGKSYLRNNLTRQLIIDKGFKTIKKEGLLHSTVTVRVTTENGAQSEVKNEFESTY